ncbi:MAG: phosphatase PAP2 family protein [Bacteroidales bacterium]|nr:phosphatase PAP2 family protein [Bacteroidales bacterium]
MRNLLVILLLLSPVGLRAQWDTATPEPLPMRKYLGPAITGVSLVGMGSLLAFQPDMHDLAVTLRDEVLYHDLPKIHADDYVQYLPALTPVVLNLCGVKGRHGFWKLAQLEGASYLLGGGWLNAAKYGFALRRPDNSTHNSFPSGHTFFAFTGAEILRREYGKEYPWLAVAGYAVATLVGIMRIYNNRHWAGDVLAGAGLGILSVSLVYWTLD